MPVTSGRSLNRNDSLGSSVKRSSCNLEMSQVGNGVTTTVYGGSEATSTFGTSHPVATLLDDSPSQGALQGVADLGDGSGTPVPPLHPSLLPPTGTSPSPGPHLLVNPHLAHLEASSSSQPQLSSQVSTQGPGPHCLLPQGPTTASLGPRDRPTLSQDSLERQLAILTQNINNSNNNVVDVFVEP